MANVTDSLDMVWSQLGELEHHLDATDSHLADVGGNERLALHDARATLALARGHLRGILLMLERERQSLARLSGMIQSLRCENCHRYFEASGGAASRREYCSPACRQAAYRARLDASQVHGEAVTK
jgi:hypothetical protein